MTKSIVFSLVGLVPIICSLSVLSMRLFGRFIPEVVGVEAFARFGEDPSMEG